MHFSKKIKYTEEIDRITTLSPKIQNGTFLPIINDCFFILAETLYSYIQMLSEKVYNNGSRSETHWAEVPTFDHLTFLGQS